MDMFDRLEDTVNRYEDITAELGNPDVVNDQNRFRKLMKEQSDILPIVEAYKEYKQCKQNIEDSLAMLEEESDEEMREMLKEELADTTKLIVAQRISTIMDADLILVLDQGKVVGQGTHKELLATNEVYQEIAYSQLSKEELEHA